MKKDFDCLLDVISVAFIQSEVFCHSLAWFLSSAMKESFASEWLHETDDKVVEEEIEMVSDPETTTKKPAC